MVTGMQNVFGDETGLNFFNTEGAEEFTENTEVWI
jgi:hypothetical protein